MLAKLFAPLRLCVFALILCWNSTAQQRYELRPAADPNGIAKYYMGRQIAHVMGHVAADWLERPTREAEEHTEKMISLLNLKPGENVADIGAGTGYITWRMAKKVAPNGKVYAVEIQQEMLDLLSKNMTDRGITNVVQALGTVTDPKLPTNALDLIIMVDVYHEFDHPYEMTDAMVRSLKTGGRLVFIEFKKEDPNVPIKEVHKMSEAQVKKEMSIHPLEHSQTLTNLPWQHIIIFKKKAEKPNAALQGSESGLQPATLTLTTLAENTPTPFPQRRLRGTNTAEPIPPLVPHLDSRPPPRITVENTRANPIPANPKSEIRNPQSK